jgi:hypothetical protein
MLKQTAVIAILAASVLATGCDDDDDEVPDVRPTAIQTGVFTGASAAFVSVNPLVIVGQPIGFGGPCPAVQPFGGRFNVVIVAGHSDVFFTSVRLGFVDANPTNRVPVTLPMPVPTTQFGTALVQARSTRIFPFDFRFGCGTSRSGTMIMLVDTRDDKGRTATKELKVTVN